MADLPAPTPAADPANPGQQPEPSSADNKPSDPPAPSATAVVLTDDQKTYLKGQGLTDAELASPDALAKIINHAQTSQKTLAETKMQLDKIKDTVVPPKEPSNPFAPQPTDEGQPPTQPTDKPAPKKGLDRVTAYTLATNLATSFPDLKEELTTGKFYEDMQSLGIPTTLPNGEVNLDGILKYGDFAQKQKAAEAKLKEEGKPGEGDIPDANPTAPAQPASDAPMTEQMAKAILLQDPNHARAAEAKQFLQDHIKGKK